MSKRIRSSRQSHFAIVPQNHHSRSAFKCDHGYKTTFNSGYLIPFLWDEVTPGDTVNVSATAMIRFATLLFPLMDNMRFYTYYFFVPNRLLWTNFKKFMGEQDNPGDSIAYTVPKMTSTAVTGYLEGTIYDYFGLPTNVAGFDHISLPLRAYNQVYNQWFKDENLINNVPVNLGDTSDSAADYTLLRSCKVRDYFTSGLPFLQKGVAASLPLGTTAPVLTSGTQIQMSTPAVVNAGLQYQLIAGQSEMFLSTAADATNRIVVFGTNTGLYTDLSAATAATINQLRQAITIQQFLERDARGGTRYQEIVMSHFNTFIGDSSVQIPQYLGGSSDPLNVSVVAQTAPASGGSTPLASLAGFGTAVLHDHGFTHSFVEHGILLGLIVARADLNYMQGLNRKWSRSIRYDYPWPEFAHLGEQAILNKEIYCQGTAGGTDDAGVFAYQERYAESRYYPNLITSLFRSNATGTLDSWHLAQNFGSLPTLGSTFIVDNPPTARVKATSGDPDFIMDMKIRHTVVSCLPTYSVPGLHRL